MSDKSIEHLKAHAPLGKSTSYNTHYDPNLLFAVPRIHKRQELGITNALPFNGSDVWNAYELSWLNLKGKPQVAIARITVPASSPNIFESKSLKLYLNSFNNMRFENSKKIQVMLTHDLNTVTKDHVSVEIFSVDELSSLAISSLPGENIDHLDIEIKDYMPKASYLKTTSDDTDETETLTTHLLKSNCLITNQPDWGSLYIQYSGKKISRGGLLKYIVSLRNHNEFHEQCVERIFMNIMKFCQPKKLTVYALYTRRGGIDINPYRTTEKSFKLPYLRLVRQ